MAFAFIATPLSIASAARARGRSRVEAYAQALSGARPGLILFVQTFGDLANFNPHVLVLAADRAFRPDGPFIPLPPVPEALVLMSIPPIGKLEA